MNFELKHGDSGHSQIITFDRVVKGEDIMNHIGGIYKISPKDQLLITKIGHIIQPKQVLDKVFTEELDDKTLASGFKNANKNENKRVPCICLFNLKQLNRADEACEGRSKAYWVEELKDKLININNQSSIAFPFESLSESYTEEQLQKYDRFAQKINSLKESYIKFANQYSDMKEYCYKVEQVWDRCKNQKKSAFILIKAIKLQLSSLLEKLKQASQLKQTLKSKFAIDDKSLRQNSGFFQSRKKNESSVSLYETQLKSAQNGYMTFGTKYKQNANIWKSKFRTVEQGDIQFGHNQYNSKIQECHQLIKKDYDEVLTLFNQLVQSNGSYQSKYGVALEAKIQRSSQNISNYLIDELSQIYEAVINYYCLYNQINEESKIKIKNMLIWYNQCVRQISNYQKTLVSIGKAIKSEIQQQNKRKISVMNKKLESSLRQISESQIISEKNNGEQLQIKRRFRFKQILNSIQSFASKICYQEQTLRKKFVNELKNNEKYSYECLRNAKVPQIDLEDNNSSDLQLMKICKNSNAFQMNQSLLSSQQFMIFSFNLVLEKIKGIDINDNSSKVKNLQQILKRLTDVFAKVYNKKINDLIIEKQEINSRIPQLEQKIASLQSQLENNRYEIIELTRKITEKQDKLIVREKERSEQINKERSKYEKLYSDFKSLEKTLSKQTKVNEELYNQFLKSQDELKDSAQLNEYLKELLAQKQIQIIEIQKKLQQDEKQEPKLVQNDLKSAVFHNFSKDIKKIPQQDSQIQRLNQQIVLLQKQNEELQEQYQELSTQMRKIITKQTQDIQIQVNTQDPILKTLLQDGIRISEEITVGQNALFMPFSNSIYVGVNHKDDDRTLCNINNMQFNNYFLDFSNFNSKTKELLSQCSFLIVLHVTSIEKQAKNTMVKGQIRHIFGFEDDNTTIKNYASLLPN